MRATTFRMLVPYAVLALTVSAVGLAHAGEEAQYKADVPASVMTPGSVKTDLLGELKFFDGMPDEDTVRKIYDFLDTSRAAEAFLNGIPAASVYALLEGFKEAGLKPGELGMYEDLMDARSLFLTANSTTMYCMTEARPSRTSNRCAPAIFSATAPRLPEGIPWYSSSGCAMTRAKSSA